MLQFKTPETRRQFLILRYTHTSGENIMKNLPIRIKHLRIEQCFKQRDVACYLGIPQQTYSNYEHGIRELPARHVRSLAKLYGVSTDYLLGTQPRRAGSFDPHSIYVQDIPLKNVLLDFSRLNENNRTEIFRFMSYLNNRPD